MSVALFITIIAIHNMIDYQVNYDYLTQIMSMEHTFKSKVMSHAITNPVLCHLALTMIIIWEVMASGILWFGAIKSFRNLNDSSNFEASKQLATIGLLFLLLMFGFIFYAIGGQYFASWQSQVYNSVHAANKYFPFVGIITILWMMPERE